MEKPNPEISAGVALREPPKALLAPELLPKPLNPPLLGALLTAGIEILGKLFWLPKLKPLTGGMLLFSNPLKALLLKLKPPCFWAAGWLKFGAGVSVTSLFNEKLNVGAGALFPPPKI